jgi:O-antigen/teichoic acid export membrane protein
MSYERLAFRSGLWFSGFRFLSQGISWYITVLVARALNPADYGLMAMASILTGYIEIFSEMGLGSAIVQKIDVVQKELSSVFWLTVAVGVGFGIASFWLAYPTALIFREPRVIPITRLISVVFVISSLAIVPYSILTRDIKFKEIGIIQFAAVLGSSLSMLWMARSGFGVWTLIGGTIVHRIISVGLTFWISKWCPDWHFDFGEAKALLKFGVNVASSRSLFYVFQKSDKFIVGKMFNAKLLGFYSFAMQLASIPMEKIVAIINQIAFPVFSRYQNDVSKSNDLYLKLTEYVAIIVAPLFFGGFVLGDELVLILLGEKWQPVTYIFKLLCISNFAVSLTSISGIIHLAQGRPQWGLIFTGVSTVFMSLSIYVAAVKGFEYVVIPWISIYPILCFGWTWVTLRKLKIQVYTYLRSFITAGAATACMIIGITVFRLLRMATFPKTTYQWLPLVFEIGIGAFLYLTYLSVFERKEIRMLWKLTAG